jgi:exodeoxyribonuclease V alpha subunit
MIYTLNQLANDGHCYAERGQLIKSAKELLAADEEPIIHALDNMIKDEVLILDDGAVFLPVYYYSEVGVAGKLKALLKNQTGKLTLDGLDIDKISKESNIEYDDVQVDAIKQAVLSKVMVLTGNPGTGKTTTLLGIIAAFESFKLQIVCAAPTGRAAKRMSEATGKEAKTIHRLLEFNPKGGFARNEHNPLDGDVLIVDESSMIDILLMNSLLKAVPAEMRLILVGDIDQLPSVGAGNVLRDIIDSGAVPVVRLTRIFRQALTSRIVTNAHKVNRGEFPDVSNDREGDFFFIKDDDPEHAAAEIVNIVKNRIPKAYGYTTNDIQVLVPMIRGVVGTRDLNIALQEAINPDGEYIQSGAFKYRVGDRVMQIKNDYDKNVFNGDIGIVQSVDSEEHVMTVLFNEVVEYEGGDLNELTLAYACTIHKSQGSEYPVVVMPLMMSHYIMLQRNLVYTGITRAKKLCIVIGTPKALAMAVKNQTVTKRNTRLKERLNSKQRI